MFQLLDNKLKQILDKANIETIEDLEEKMDDVFDDLYEYWINSGEMPYGVAKARDGDPYEWIFNKMEDLL